MKLICNNCLTIRGRAGDLLSFVESCTGPGPAYEGEPEESWNSPRITLNRLVPVPARVLRQGHDRIARFQKLLADYPGLEETLLRAAGLEGRRMKEMDREELDATFCNPELAWNRLNREVVNWEDPGMEPYRNYLWKTEDGRGWQALNWGTSSDVPNLFRGMDLNWISQLEPTEFVEETSTFQSESGPPAQFFKACARKLKALDLELAYAGEDESYSGRLRMKAGVVLEHVLDEKTIAFSVDPDPAVENFFEVPERNEEESDDDVPF